MTSFESYADNHPFFDMYKGKQIISLELYHYIDVFIEYHKYVNFKFYHMTQNVLENKFEKILLKHKSCKEVEFFKEDPNWI